MRRLAGHSLLLLLIGALLGPASIVHALDPARSLAQYKHSRWSVEDGAPSNIVAIAQSPDGFLWLGTGSGLYRFDGITFDHIDPIRGDRARSSQVSSLLVARNGDLWVGYRTGGVAIYRDGKLRPLGMPRSGESLFAMVEDKAGDIWTINSRMNGPLSRYRHGQWQRIGAAEGFADQVLSGLLAPADGSLWVAGWAGVLVRPPGQPRFVAVEGTANGSNKALAVDRQGGVWMLGNAGPRLLWKNGKLIPPGGRPDEGNPTGLAIRTHLSPRLLADRDGSLWATDQESGLIRVSRAALADGSIAPNEVQALRVTEGMTSDGVTALFEGREGEIWVGTAGGLDRIRPADVVRAPEIAAAGGGILFADRRGALYLIGASNVYRIGPTDRPSLLTDKLQDVGAQCDAPDGSLWIASGTGLLHLNRDHVAIEKLPYNPSHSSYDCLVDARGTFWLAAGADGLFRRDGTVWTAVPVAGDPRDATIVALRLDPSGRILVNVRNKGLFRITDGKPAFLWDGAPIGRIAAIGPYRDAMLVAGAYGLARFDGKAFRILSSDQYPWLANIRNLTQTATQLWLLTDRGVVEVALTDLDKAMRDRGALPHRTFDARDGLAAPVAVGAGHPITSSADGRIWITTPDGAFWIDPARLTHNNLAPPVAITALIADNKRYAPGMAATLPKGTSHLEIDFAAPSLLIPERVQFRYRLEGADTDWINPGARRQAFYTNLRPGTYRFQVIAANNDGVWNRAGASLDIHLPPTFMQSIWFVLLSVGLLIGMLWLAYAMRLRQVTERLQGRLEARLAERERIARELHDTLLQGFQGLMLRFQSVAERIPPGQPVRAVLDQALDRADAVLIEGRNRVRELRSARDFGDLGKLLVQMGHDLSGEGTPDFRLTVEGMPRELHPLVFEEMSRIGEEALRNAFRHAGATRIETAILYGRGTFALTVGDDGVGLAEDAASQAACTGRFGLLGMRERCARIGGRMTITSRPKFGTEIAATLPGRLAYAHTGWSGTALWRRWFGSAMVEA